jgi:uncharacterized membrane protein
MNSLKEQKSLSNSKICAILGTIAYILPIIAILIGIPFNYFAESKIQTLPPYLVILQPTLLFYPYLRYIDPAILNLSLVCGATFIAFGVTAFIMGIIARQIRRKAVYHEPDTSLTSIGGTFAIMGLLLAFISGFIGFRLVMLFNSLS